MAQDRGARRALPFGSTMENSPAGATGAAWAGAAAGAAGAPTSDEGREDGALVVLAGRVLTGAAPRMAAAAVSDRWSSLWPTPRPRYGARTPKVRMYSRTLPPVPQNGI